MSRPHHHLASCCAAAQSAPSLEYVLLLIRARAPSVLQIRYALVALPCICIVTAALLLLLLHVRSSENAFPNLDRASEYYKILTIQMQPRRKRCLHLQLALFNFCINPDDSPHLMSGPCKNICSPHWIGVDDDDRKAWSAWALPFAAHICQTSSSSSMHTIITCIDDVKLTMKRELV